MKKLNHETKLCSWCGKNTLKILILIVLFAFVARTICWILTPIVDQDSVLYTNMARTWYEEGADNAFALSPRMPPLYPFLLFIGEATGLGAITMGRILALVCGSITPIGVFLATYVLFGKQRYGLLAAFFVAIHPHLIDYSVEVMRASLYIAAIAFSIAFFLFAIDSSKTRYWILAGFCSALACLTRSEGIVFVFAALAFCFFKLFIGKDTFKERLKNWIPSVLIMLVIFVMLTLPCQMILSRKAPSSTWTVLDRRIDSYIHGSIKKIQTWLSEEK